VLGGVCVAAGLVIKMSCFLSFIHWSAEHLLSDGHATLPFSLTVLQCEWSSWTDWILLDRCCWYTCATVLFIHFYDFISVRH